MWAIDLNLSENVNNLDPKEENLKVKTKTVSDQSRNIKWCLIQKQNYKAYKTKPILQSWISSNKQQKIYLNGRSILFWQVVVTNTT